MLVIDVKKAHLHADVDRDVYVDLPPLHNPHDTCEEQPTPIGSVVMAVGSHPLDV